MPTFRDRNGREWVVALDVATLKRVRNTTGVDLYKSVEGGMAGLADLLGDPITLVDVLYVACQPQAEKAGVDDVRFGEAMAADAIEGMADALLQAIVDFFPNPRVRAGLTKVIEAGRRLKAANLDRMEATLDAELARLNGSSTSSPESSGPTPAP